MIRTFWDFREWYHNRFTGLSGNFQNLLKQPAEKNFIGITRFNFFQLQRFAEIPHLGFPEIPQFSVLPFETVYQRFTVYLNEIQSILKKHNFFITGPETVLENILKVLENEWNATKNKDILRLLGVLCDSVFIGPHILHIDMSNVCNIDCLYCWFHSPRIHRKEPKRTVPFEKFRRLIDQAAELGVDELLLLGEGEPFCDHEIAGHIEYIKRKGMRLELFTNGTLLDEKSAEIIAKNQVEHVYFSISAADSITYKKLHPSVSDTLFDTICTNIRRLSVLKKNRTTLPRMTFLFVVTNVNCHQIFDAVKLASELDFSSCRFQMVHGGQGDFNSDLFLSEEQIESVLNQLEKARIFAAEHGLEIFDNIDFQLPHLNSSSGNWSEGFYLKRGCLIGWYLVFFRQQGHYSFCCAPKQVGESDDDLKDLWYSEDYMRFRLAGKYMEQNRDFVFKNNEKLYTYNCERCENYDHINQLFKLAQKTDTLRYIGEGK